jgi:hypothetical protein
MWLESRPSIRLCRTSNSNSGICLNASEQICITENTDKIGYQTIKRYENQTEILPNTSRFNCLVIEEFSYSLGRMRCIIKKGLDFCTWVDMIKQVFDIMKYLYQVRLLSLQK